MTTRQIAIEGASVRKSSVSSFSSRDENFARCDPPLSAARVRNESSNLGERCASDPREISFRITRCLDLLIAEQRDCTRVLALARAAPPAARLPRVVALMGRRYYRLVPRRIVHLPLAAPRFRRAVPWWPRGGIPRHFRRPCSTRVPIIPRPACNCHAA